MAVSATRLPALRHLAACGTLPRAPRLSHQRRWAQVHDVRFLATTQRRPSILEKYRDKLDRKAREEGHAGIDELKSAYADRIREQRARDAASFAAEPGAAAQTQAQQAPSPPQAVPPPPSSSTPSETPKKSSSSTGKSNIPPLDSFLDVEKVRNLPVEDLTALWRLRHAASERSLCAVVPAHTYAAMEAAARAHPQFVLPVPHPDQGAEIHFLQWTFDAPTRTSTVLFTQLAEYKARGEFAQAHTSVTHHLDLAADRGLVLMQGQVVEGRGARVEDARWLVMCLQRFYGGWDGQGQEGAVRAEERRKLLEWFGRGDERFSVQALMEETERLA
ncbi:uncharacterized protein E0L32_003596 [Thyridium curvatum]|uniref:Uncharacterized protein n=1 Tax=Thyridium curvatum TaxID=1093900 RepID=A0A507B0N1_9PEZI|nr:uncharacterized protein E0L32_003596 [Thyridium curvatum]TPX16655.1 hypothetical protein E0L32_003596 [Thyridium curvatum]